MSAEKRVCATCEFEFTGGEHWRCAEDEGRKVMIHADLADCLAAVERATRTKCGADTRLFLEKVAQQLADAEELIPQGWSHVTDVRRLIETKLDAMPEATMVERNPAG